MGGGKKQNQRTKGNLKPSSSSRAAETLIQEGKTGFIGFGGLSEATGNTFGYVPKSIGAENESEQDIDSDLRMLMRKMTKKDTTTRLKAIQEFSKLCALKSAECVSRTLLFWPKIYNKLCEDFDHRVREATQQAHLEIVKKVGRQLAPQLKLIVGNWLKSHFDQYPPAAAVARRSFDLSFSGDKKKEALSFCKKELILNIKDVLIQQTQDTLSDPRAVPLEEREAKYNRLVSATLLSTGYLLDNLSADNVASLSSELQDIFKEKKFWKFAKHKAPMIRSAFFTAVSSSCQNCGDILKEFSQVACPTVLLCLDESDPVVVISLWECILQTVNTLEDCWQHVNARKAVLPKLWSLLRVGGFGNATVVFPNVLPFLSKVPSTVIGEGDGFYKEFFKNFREGLLQCAASSSESNSVIAAYMECLRFVILSLFEGQGEDVDKDLSRSDTISEYLINEEMNFFVQASLQEKKNCWEKLFLKKLSDFILYLEKQAQVGTGKAEVKKILEKFYVVLENNFLKCLNLKDIEDEFIMKVLLGKLEEFMKIVIFKSDVTLTQRKKKVLFSANENNEQSDNMCNENVTEERVLDRGQTKMDVLGKDLLSEYARTLLSKLCKCCVELLLEKKRLVYFSFMCNIISNVEEQPALIDLLQLVLKTRHQATGEHEKEIESFQDLVSFGGGLIHLFINPVMEENFTQEASFWDSSDCQEAVVCLLCRIIHFLEKDQRIEFMHSLNEFCSRPLLFCLFVEKVLASVETETVRVWFTNPVSWNRLITYVSQCLMHEDETNNSDTEIHVWKCLQQCLFYDSGNVPLLDSEKTKQLFVIFKNYLTSFESDQNTKDCLRILLIMTEVYKHHSDESPMLMADLLLAAFQVVFRIRDDAVMAQGNEMLRCGFDRLRVSSSNQLSDCLQRIACWVKKTCYEADDISRIKELADSSRNLISHLKTGEDDVIVRNIVNDFVYQLLQSNEMKNLDRQGLHLLPSVLSGMINISNLNDIQDSRAYDDLKKAVNCALFGTILVSNIDEDWLDSAARNATILSAVDLCAYNYGADIEKYVSVNETTNVAVIYVLLSFSELEQIIRNLLQSGNLITEELINTSLDRSMQKGGLYVLSLERLCTTISACSQSELPVNEMLACAMSRGYNDADAVDVLKVILMHLDDVSMLRAMVEQFTDQLGNCSSDDIQGFSRALDLCTTSVIRWQQVLQNMKEKSHDFTDVVKTITDQLIEWKDNAQEALLFAADLSEVENSLLDVNIKIMRLLGFVLSTKVECLDRSHWDFLLCSLASWIQTCEENLATLSQDPQKMVFGYEAFNLCAFAGLAFERLIGTNIITSNVIKPELGINNLWQVNSEWMENNRPTVSDELVSEWQEFFAPAIYKGIYLLYKEVLSVISEGEQTVKSCNMAIASHLLQSISCALNTTPAMVFIDIVVGKLSFEEQLATSSTQAALSSSEHSFDETQIRLIQETMDTLSRQLASKFFCVQTVALSLLYKMIDHVHGVITTMTDESTEGDECDVVRSFPDKLHSVLESCQESITSYLDEEAIKFGSYLQKSPSNQQTKYFLGYMFSWQSILRMFRGAEADQRAAYANFFRKRGLIGPLLKIVFSLLPHEAGHLINGKSVSIKGDAVSLQTLQQCAFQVYLSALECIPAVIRSWCNNNMDRKSSGIIERFTCNYISPIICNREIEQVSNSSKTFTNMSIKTRPAAREVVALYTVEEISMELVVKMSQSHPFGHVIVECGKRVGVSNAQWRQWMLQLTMYLTQQNGTIVDGLSLWKRNVDKKFEGVEECMVCFSVVHGTNYQLPTITCRVCKKKFHSACLYKWFSTSNKSTCPLCRNSF